MQKAQITPSSGLIRPYWKRRLWADISLVLLDVSYTCKICCPQKSKTLERGIAFHLTWWRRASSLFVKPLFVIQCVASWQLGMATSIVSVCDPTAHREVTHVMFLGRTTSLTATRWYVQEACRSCTKVYTGSSRFRMRKTLLPNEVVYWIFSWEWRLKMSLVGA
jgi:hypothetical protein